MDNKLQISDQSKQSQMMQVQEQNQVLTLQKMRELEKEIDNKKEEVQSIKDIIKVDNVELNPMLKLNEAYLVELENERNELSYQLYTENGLIGISNEEGLIELDPNYIAEMDEKFGEYGGEYLIPAENKMLDPNVLQEQSLEPYRKSELENNIDKNEPNKQEKRENPDETMSKIESDLGCDISSCIRIEDEDFSQEVLGHQTGHQEKYIAYSKSRNTFLLIGKNGNNFEEIQDICGAQGGGEAARKTYCEYDEQGRAVDVEAPSFVMTRNDGKQGALAIDMHYGEICLSNLTPNEQEVGKYDSEEIRIGHSIKPTPDEIELAKEREEKAKAIAEKEEEVRQLKENKEDTDNEENEGERTQEVEEAEKELDEMKAKAEEDDDIYDWSTGRPIPRH